MIFVIDLAFGIGHLKLFYMTDENKKEEQQIIDWQAKAEEYLNGWKRAQADYQNREKEIGKEREVLRGFFEESLILEFLPVLDNLKSAISTIGHPTSNSCNDGLIKGILQVAKLAEDILKKFGVEKIDVLDKDFDPAVCEAAEKEGEGNKVIKVVADGYKKGDRVIRPARVIVG